jgi:RNA polymerase sigma-B factor
MNLQVMRANEALAQQLGRAPTIGEIAAHVGASEDETLEAIELGNAFDTVSLDSQLTFEGEAAPLTLNDTVGRTDGSLENLQFYDDLKDAVESLDNREKMVIYLRFFQDLSQSEVAQRLRISQMHVSRLQAKALAQLRKLMTESGEDETPP